MPDVDLRPDAPGVDPRPDKLAPRNPTYAFALSFLWPGLGQLYCGQPGVAMLFGLGNHLLAPLLLFGWAIFQYSAGVYGLGVWVGVLLFRLVSAPAAFLAAHRASQRRTTFQTPGAYGFFLIGSLLAGQLLMRAVTEYSAEGCSVSEDREGFLAGDEILLRKGAEASAPTVGKVVVFNRDLPPALDSAGKAQPAMRELGLGRVLTVEADSFTVDALSTPLKRKDYRGEARAVFLSRGKDRRLRWERIGLRPLE